MSRVLTGVTHAIVTIPSQEDARASKTYALVDLCFGPGDDTSISGIRYARTEDGPCMWQSPMYKVIREGKMAMLPVFKGDLFVETTQLAARAMAHVKKDLGKAAWSTRYRVFKTHVEIEAIPKE